MTLDPATGKFVAAIPRSFIVPEWDLMYLVEALAKNGDGQTAPDMEQEMPYVIVPVTPCPHTDAERAYIPRRVANAAFP